MIEIEGLAKSYDGTAVLSGVALALPRSGVTAIIGPNGAGKSTLLSIMGRLLKADGGRVLVDGMDVATTPSDIIARRLSILRQENHIPARLTVRDLVSFGRYPYSKGRYTADDLAHVERAIGYLGLEELEHRFLDELSGGQRQRAYIATVLCQDTDYVLLDEPMNSLDIKHAVAIMRLVRNAARDLGKSVIAVLHDINMAAAWCDHIIVMKDGGVVRHGPPTEIMSEALLTHVYETPVSVRELEGRLVALY